MSHPFVPNVRKVLLALLQQKNRLMDLEFPNGDAPVGTVLEPHELIADEGISRDFGYTVTLLADQAHLEAQQLMGKLLVIKQRLTDGGTRYFSGYVTRFAFVRNEGGFTHYEVVLSPFTAFLEQTRDYRVFLNQTVQEQLTELMAAFAPCRWEAQNLGPDKAMTFACLYNESIRNYIYRRIAQRGWYFYWEHTAEGHTLQIRKDSTLCPAIEGGTVVWQNTSGNIGMGQHSLRPIRTLAPTQFSARSTDYRTPNRHPQAETPTVNPQGSQPDMEVYDFPGHYAFDGTPEADAYTRRQMEAIEAASAWFEADGDPDTLLPGHSYRLIGYRDGGILSLIDQDKDEFEFFILGAQHTIRNNHPVHDDKLAQYHCNWMCMRRKIPWRPPLEPYLGSYYKPKVEGTQTARVVGPAGAVVHTDELGRALVQFSWDKRGTFDERSSCWLRPSWLHAGDQHGLVALLRVGQEVDIEFMSGDPDRPVIAGSRYNATHLPAQFSHTGGLPGNRCYSGWTTQEFQGHRANQLRFDDTPGQISAQLASDHGASQLNLGHLAHPRINGDAVQRGEGFDLCTNLSGTVRAGTGLNVTTFKRENASGKSLDRQELLAQLEVAFSTFKALTELALKHEAGGTDTAPAQKLLDDLKQWDSQQAGGVPVLALSSAAGMALSSEASTALTAGSNMDIVAAQDATISTGRRINLQAAQGVFAFAHKLGMKLIAGAGDVVMRALDGPLELLAAKVLKLISLDKIIASAPAIELQATGASITLADGVITFKADSEIKHLAPQFSFEGGSGGSPELPALPGAALKADERYVLKLRNAAAPAANRRYKVTLKDGQTVAGQTDDQGQTDLAKADALLIADIQVFNDAAGGKGDATTSSVKSTESNRLPAKYDMKFLVKDEKTGEPLANVSYKLTLESGEEVLGETDKNGLTQTIGADTAQQIKLEAPYHGNCSSNDDSEHGHCTCGS